jgi:uncharacterized protein (TIGR04255 family)
MHEADIRLPKPPIVEAVLDIDCDLSPKQSPASMLEAARATFAERYPKLKVQKLHEHRIQSKPDTPPELDVREGLLALRFLQQDDKQLVQVRAQGFSFNRLEPYTTLDDYLPEIERTWNQYREVASPFGVRMIRLRYINRILLPGQRGQVDLDQYLKLGPHLPDEENLKFIGFVHQHEAEEVGTGHRVSIVLATQGFENQALPIILDTTAAARTDIKPEEWSCILGKIQALRTLNKLIFRDTLTDRCLQLFQ